MSCVITYSYTDGSGCGIVAAFDRKEDAEKILLLLNSHGDLTKEFKLVCPGRLDNVPRFEGFAVEAPYPHNR